MCIPVDKRHRIEISRHSAFSLSQEFHVSPVKESSVRGPKTEKVVLTPRVLSLSLSLSLSFSLSFSTDRVDLDRCLCSSLYPWWKANRCHRARASSMPVDRVEAKRRERRGEPTQNWHGSRRPIYPARRHSHAIDIIVPVEISACRACSSSSRVRS